jgi:hypothetical protein
VNTPGGASPWRWRPGREACASSPAAANVMVELQPTPERASARRAIGHNRWARASEPAGGGRTGLSGCSVALEVLHGALVLFRRSAGCECSEVAPFAGARVELARIQTVLAVAQLADHVRHLNRHARNAYRQAPGRSVRRILMLAAQPPADTASSASAPDGIKKGSRRCALTASCAAVSLCSCDLGPILVGRERDRSKTGVSHADDHYQQTNQGSARFEH